MEWDWVVCVVVCGCVWLCVVVWMGNGATVVVRRWGTMGVVGYTDSVAVVCASIVGAWGRGAREGRGGEATGAVRGCRGYVDSTRMRVESGTWITDTVSLECTLRRGQADAFDRGDGGLQ